jgi:GNAT superfamily N-acetyltransferase
MPDLGTRPLAVDTWPAFARLVEGDGGVWGGCWCMGFHEEGVGKHKTVEQNRREKEARVRSGDAHAALVFDGDDCVGWCQFGPTDELPRIKARKQVLAAVPDTPDWRITCFYVGKGHRGQGVADAALGGAVAEIARLGGGVVESYPETVTGRKTSGSFLFNATCELFERHGFERVAQVGKHRWVVRRDVASDA